MFRDVSCGHLTWRLEDEDRRIFYQSLAALFADVSEKFRPNSEKNPRVRKTCVRNSGDGNGCVNFMDAWKNASVLQEKPCP